MKRLHVHVSVKDLDASIRFYSHLFAAEPTVRKADYAKWMLEDPRVNFAISQRDAKAGVQHLGIQVEDRTELAFLTTGVSTVYGTDEIRPKAVKQAESGCCAPGCCSSG
jgi:catechol 2,3-dioxygenase-like lactoylglutathione lyase family enzyme